VRQPVIADERVTIAAYIGIDPGLSGVMAVLFAGSALPRPRIELHPAPTVRVKVRKARSKKSGVRVEYDVHEFRQLLKPFEGRNVIAGIEHLRGYPGASSQAVFGMGYGFGLWVMALATCQIPYTLVPPQTWKRALSVLGKPGQPDQERKAATVLRAKQLFPWIDLPYKKDHNSADALLLAEYMRRTNPL